MDLSKAFVYDDKEIIHLRQKQIDALDKKKFPKVGKIKFEEYDLVPTSIKYIKEDKVSQLPKNINRLIDDKENIVVVKDGNIIYSDLDEAFNVVKIMSYFDALENNDEDALKHFQQHFTKSVDNKFKSLNYAYQNSGILIDVPKNVILKDAIKIHVIGEKSDLVHHTIIVGGQSSEFTVFENFANLKPIHVNAISDVNVSENAKVNYIGIDRLDRPAFIERNGFVNRDGSLIYALGQLNDGHTVSNNIVKLLGKNAYCETRNVLLTDKENMHAVTVYIEHLAPLSNGTILNHGIVKDKGLLHIDGIGKIHQGMNQSNAQQSTNIITLSGDAKVTANPLLLIDEYDVMAGHGAGIGKVDEKQLYYLMSRGLKRKEAEKLIILGFLYPIIEMIDSEKIKDSFIETIENKLSF